jgi:transposase
MSDVPLLPAPGCPNCARLAAEVERLKQEVVELKAQVRELVARLDQNSSNSSKPPSSEPPWRRPQPPRPPSGRAPGAQPGHEGHHRQRLPPERVANVIHLKPRYCEHCHETLPDEAGPQDPPESWHQVAELPPQVAEITEYQAHARTCPHCGKITRAEIPAEIRAHTTGPRLAAALSYLSGRCHCSKRCVQEVAQTIFDVPLALGTVTQLEQETSAALQAPHQEALQAVRGAPAKYVDETSWFVNGELDWLWVAATVGVVVFQIHAQRGKKGLQALLGQIIGIICSDRWGAYADLPPSARQLCWAHQKRDFERLYELGEGTRPLGRAGRRAVKKLFAIWKDFKDQRIDRAELQARLQPVRVSLHSALQRGAEGTDGTTKRFCRRILKVYEALWTFAAVEGVEPTNNLAERMVRPGVLWRKGSFGNHSAAGCRFTERILTVVQTLHLQQRPVLDYLCRALAAQRAGTAAPALLAA